MPRFYLHVRNGANWAEDLEGQYFPTLADARDEAIQAAREIMSDRVRRGQEVDHSQIEIVNEAGQLVHTVPFKEVIKGG